jgi:hypothetical protein
MHWHTVENYNIFIANIDHVIRYGSNLVGLLVVQ